MDYKLVSGVLVVLCVALAAYAIIGAGGAKTVCQNNTVYPTDDLRVYYLYPLRCVNCNLNVPGQCDFCNSYYDERMMDLVSQDVGVPVKYYVSDVVERPNVFVASNEKVTLGDARNRLNIAQTLCRFAKVAKSCKLFNSEMSKVASCLKDYNLMAGEVVYHTSATGCTMCAKTDAVVGDLLDQDYNDTMKYSVYKAESTAQSGQIMTKCLQMLDSGGSLPQLICPDANKDLTGEFTLSQARDFADRCIENRWN
jgi:hypothetical protein